MYLGILVSDSLSCCFRLYMGGCLRGLVVCMCVFPQLIGPPVLFQVTYIGGAAMSLFLDGELALSVCSLVEAAAARLPGVKGR